MKYQFVLETGNWNPDSWLQSKKAIITEKKSSKFENQVQAWKWKTQKWEAEIQVYFKNSKDPLKHPYSKKAWHRIINSELLLAVLRMTLEVVLTTTYRQAYITYSKSWCRLLQIRKPTSTYCHVA